MADRPIRQCVQCGQTDDHPKNLGSQGPKHHDCLSFQEKADIEATNPDVFAVIQACEGGLRGNDLLDHIVATFGGK
jgi:hypothetical protein